jgi:hypothetical protein
MKKNFWIGLTCLILLASCDSGTKEVAISADTYHDTMQQLTDVIVHDIFSPPVASRIYAYPSIAAYEIMALGNSEYKSMAGQLTGFEAIPQPSEEVSMELAAIEAFIKVGTALIFSEDQMTAYKEELYASLKEGVNQDFFDKSIAYGDEVAAHIMAWSSKDNYAQTRTFPKFTITEDETRWQPTPPAYIEAIEPHWNKIRPFVLDSAQQFAPEVPTAFNMTDKNSPFYKEVLEVYEVGNTLTDEQKEIASFWDCNPYVVNVTGHVMYASKKITPGGHWIGIVKVACEQESADFMKAAQAYAVTSIALADGFISCWDEKYRSNLIRPETLINQHIDEEWLPLLQTPPFPEYTSGHSVISSAAAIALTSIFGEDFAFEDDTEVKYGLTVRSFKSFIHASEEAAVSRLYGGIHYRPAIDNGVTQGRALGRFVVENLETEIEALSSKE